MSSETWTAEDLARPDRRRRVVLTLAGVVVAGLLSAVLFVLPGPPQPEGSARDPGHFGRLEHVDQVPGYTVDTARRQLGPARIELHDGTRLFVPARTPYSGARPCAALLPPEDDHGSGCAVYAWFDPDSREVWWLTLLRPGGPDEALLTGRLLAARDGQLVLHDGTSIRRGAAFRLSECDDRSLDELVGTEVVVSVDAEQGVARQVTCRS